MAKTITFDTGDLTNLIKITVAVDSTKESIMSYFEVKIDDNI